MLNLPSEMTFDELLFDSAGPSFSAGLLRSAGQSTHSPTQLKALDDALGIPEYAALVFAALLHREDGQPHPDDFRHVAIIGVLEHAQWDLVQGARAAVRESMLTMPREVCLLLKRHWLKAGVNRKSLEDLLELVRSCDPLLEDLSRWFVPGEEHIAIVCGILEPAYAKLPENIKSGGLRFAPSRPPYGSTETLIKTNLVQGLLEIADEWKSESCDERLHEVLLRWAVKKLTDPDDDMEKSVRQIALRVPRDDSDWLQIIGDSGFNTELIVLRPETMSAGLHTSVMASLS